MDVLNDPELMFKMAKTLNFILPKVKKKEK